MDIFTWSKAFNLFSIIFIVGDIIQNLIAKEDDDNLDD